MKTINLKHIFNKQQLVLVLSHAELEKRTNFSEHSLNPETYNRNPQLIQAQRHTYKIYKVALIEPLSCWFL